MSGCPKNTSIFRYLPSWKVVQLFGSPECHPSDLYHLEKYSISNVSPELHHGVKEAAYQFSDLYPRGKVSSSWVLQSTTKCHPCSLRGHWRFLRGVLVIFDGCPKDISRKLRINFQISTLLESGPTPGFSRASSKCLPWSLRGRSRFLRGVLVVFDMVDVSRIHQGSYISIFSSLPSWEVLHLQCVSRA